MILKPKRVVLLLFLVAFLVLTSSVHSVQAADWISPTGFEDPDSVWMDEPNMYDEDIDSYATSNVPKKSWSGWLVLTHAALSCDKIRYFLGEMHADFLKIEVEVEKDGSWIQIYLGQLEKGVWVEKSFTEGSVTGVRLRFYNNGNFIPWAAMPCEVDFWEVSAQEYQRTTSFAITIINSVSSLSELLRDVEYSINVSFSSSGLGEFIRAVAYAMNVALNMIGAAAFERAISFGFTLGLLSSKLAEFKRDSSYSMSISQSASKSSEFLRSTTYNVAVDLSSVALGEYSRSCSYSFTVDFSSIGVISYIRSISYGITVSLGASKLAEFGRDCTYSFTIDQAASKSAEFSRSTLYNVAVAYLSSGLGEFSRDASYSFTVTFSGASLGSYERLADYMFNVALSNSKLCEFSRTSAYSISVSYQTSKLAEFYRANEYAINCGLSAIAQKISIYERSISYTITFNLATSKLCEFQRASAYTINVNIAIGRLCEFLRSSSFSFSTSYSTGKLAEFYRPGSYVVSIDVSMLGEKVGGFQRFLTYLINLVINPSEQEPTPEEDGWRPRGPTPVTPPQTLRIGPVAVHYAILMFFALLAVPSGILFLLNKESSAKNVDGAILLTGGIILTVLAQIVFPFAVGIVVAIVLATVGVRLVLLGTFTDESTWKIDGFLLFVAALATAGTLVLNKFFSLVSAVSIIAAAICVCVGVYLIIAGWLADKTAYKIDGTILVAAALAIICFLIMRGI